MLELRLLGQFDVRRQHERVSIPSRPAQSLLAYLALSAGTAHRREKLATLLWPEADEDNARSYLRHALWRARKAIEGERRSAVPHILADELSVAFNPRSSCWVDVTTLERGVGSAHALDDLRSDLDLYRGELLPGFLDEWVGPERDRLEALFQRGMQRLTDQLATDGRWQDVVEAAEGWISRVHSPEGAYRALMLAASELGDRARVAATYDRCRRALFEDLGVEPSSQTRALYEQLSSRNGVLHAADIPLRVGLPDRRAPSPGETPYKGLQSFEESDAALFFGRELTVARLAARLAREHVLAVVGDSGSGKSSVVRAGLVPAWRERRVTVDGTAPASVLVITPTARPLEALAACLRPDPTAREATARIEQELAGEPNGLRQFVRRGLPRSGGVLLVVDQFEELFSLCRDGFEREAFIDNLLAAADGTLDLVVALRADFYASCAQYPALRKLLGEHQEYLGPMNSEELRRAIEAPALETHWELEEGLVDMVLRDAGEEPGALPLVSHALLETWRRREGRGLTLRGYAASGGVQGSIARTAERVFTEQLATTQQDIARRVFVQLTELGEGNQDTRRRVSVDDLVRPNDQARMQNVLNALADARLITVSQDSVDVAHEALIREWPRLRGWLDEDRTWLRSHRQLGEAASEWERMGRDPDALHRGARLAQALEWRDQHATELSALEQDFLTASTALAERESADREARQQRELDAERRTSARLRARAVYLGIAFLAALSMVGVALFLGRQADYNASAARGAARLATARELAAAAVANLPVDPERSTLLALQAVATTRDADGSVVPDASDALHLAVLNSRALLNIPAGTPGAATLGAAFSPDGTRVAANSEDGTTRIWDAASGRLSLMLNGDGQALHGVAFSPDGTRIATTAVGGVARIWDAASGQKLLEIHAHPRGLYGVKFSPDGRMFGAGDYDGVAHIWDTASGSELATLPADSDDAFDVEFSPDGSRVATSGVDGWARVWELTPPRQVLAIPGTSRIRSAGPWHIAFSPDGTQLAVVDYREAYLWDFAQGREVRRFVGHTNDVLEVAFSPDGTRLATAGLDRHIEIWDVATGRGLFAMAGHTNIIYSIAFSPDGNRLVSASHDGSVRVWDLRPSHELWAAPTPAFSSGRLAFTPDGRRVLLAQLGSATPVWDAENGEPRMSLRGGETAGYADVAASPDGRLLAASTQEGQVWLWDAASGALLRSFSANTGRILGIAFSPDSHRLATGGGNLVKVWDLTKENSDAVTMTGHTAEVIDVAFSPDGRWVVSGSIDRTARLWDAATGSEVRRFIGHTDNVWGVHFSPDGTQLATASRDGTGGVWDVSTGRWLVRLTGHTSTVVEAVFNPDGRTVATASRDGTAKLWDSRTGASLLTLHGGEGGLNGVAFSPDGTRLATGGESGVRMYVLPIDELVQLARSRLTRDWTPDECHIYLHVDRCLAAS